MDVREERLRSTVVLRNYRAPDHGYASYRSRGIGRAGCVALAGSRLVASYQGKQLVDVDVDPARPWPDGVAVCADRPDRLAIGVDAVRHLGAHTGTVEVWMRTPHAAEIVRRLGLGLLDEKLRAEARFAAEGLAGSIRSGDRHELTSAAVAVTAARLVVRTGRAQRLDVPLVGGRPAGVTLRRRWGGVEIGYRPDGVGEEPVEIRLSTSRARELIGSLTPAGG